VSNANEGNRTRRNLWLFEQQILLLLEPLQMLSAHLWDQEEVRKCLFLCPDSFAKTRSLFRPPQKLFVITNPDSECLKVDKMITTGKGETIITNDGNTMLKSMAVMHPSAKMLVDLSAAQDVEAGEGTTSVVVIAGSLLGAADR